MNLREKPFYLSEEDIRWVDKTLSSMSCKEKVGHLFCPLGTSLEPEYLKQELLDRNVGGVLFRPTESEKLKEVYTYLQSNSRIPLLIAANLESGGRGAGVGFTRYGQQMAVAATGDKKNAYLLGKISCSEGSSIGVNWALAPVVDIDINYHNPITNVRTYGSDANKVAEYAGEYIRAAKECNVATAAKHFPGDGIDERDQHILTSVNSLSMEEWDNTYGKVYKEVIEAGTLSIMAGHIAMPAYQEFYGEDTKTKLMPATLSKALLQDLLRKQLGFQGLVVTDSTLMLGFMAAMERRVAVPMSIECGCDMFLFNMDMEEDFQFMLDGYRNGILSEERLTEANRRILAVKAALGLHRGISDSEKVDTEEHRKWSRQLADKSITLVKDTQQVLPISSEKTKRILLQVMGPFNNEKIICKVKQELESKGFDVYLYNKESSSEDLDNVKSFKNKYDLVVYVANVLNMSNQTTNRLHWYHYRGQGNNFPWFVCDVPTIFISLANPYHLLDAPMMKTYINCYSNHDCVLEEVVKKLVGESKFKGVSPIDPFCGLEELKY